MTRPDKLDELLRNLLTHQRFMTADEIHEQTGHKIGDPALGRAMKSAGVVWDQDEMAYTLKGRRR